MISWGTMACLHATAKSYAQLLVLRFLLGVFEAGFFPGRIKAKTRAWTVCLHKFMSVCRRSFLSDALLQKR